MNTHSYRILLSVIIAQLMIMCTVGQSLDKIQAEDSLNILLEQADDDSSKLEILTNLAELFGSRNRQKSIDYYLQALNYNMDESRKARMLNNVGFYYWSLGKFDDALDFYHQSLSRYSKLNDSARIGLVTNNIASANWAMGNWNDALQYYQSALLIRRAINDRKGVSTILNNMGLLYQNFGVYDQAISSHNEALDIALEIDDANSIAYSYSNLGNCYKMKNEYDKALQYHHKAYKIYSESDNDGRNNSYFLANIGMAYSEQGNVDSAVHYYNQSLAQAKSINNEHRIAIAQYNLGKTYLNQGKTDKADVYIKKSYRYALENQYQDLIRDNLFALSKINTSKGNPKTALKYFKKATSIKDSLFNKAEISKFTELTIRQIQEIEEKEKSLLKENIEIQSEIIREERTVKWLLITGSIIVLLAFIYIALSRESIKKLNTKLQKSEQELKQSNADKDKFFSIISHDLKSPFNAILGYANLLETQYDELDKTKIKEYINLQHVATRRAYNLLDDLLKWAQTQTGRVEYTYEIMNLSESVKTIIELLHPIATNKGVLVNNTIKNDTTAYADKDATETVLRNLISNAIKFTRKGGKVTIDAEIKEAMVWVSVSDNGIGMPDEVKDNLFEIGSYKSTPGTNDEKGTGLGLIICKEFVEKQGGQIWVESEQGKGSRFTFSLPLKD